MEQYLESITVTSEDFRKSRWLEAICEVKRRDYFSISQTLLSAAKQAIKEERFSEGKVLWLLADACSMILKPSNRNEPFEPFMMVNGKRSTLPEDFQSEVAFFAEIITEITDPRLCARISDIVWHLKKPKDYKHALMAIDNYLQIPIDISTDGCECWERAIQLCLMLKTGSGERLSEIEKILLKYLEESTIKNNNLVWRLVYLLAKCKLDKNDKAAISEKLEKLAIDFYNTGDLDSSIAYFDAAADWYQKNKNFEKFAEMTVKVAEGLVQKAVKFNLNVLAASFYEEAILKYRTIPKVSRTTYNVDNIISELQTKMNSTRKCSLSEFIISPNYQIDITESVKSSKKIISGKSTLDALLILANIFYGTKVNKISSISEEIIEKSSLRTLFSEVQVHISKDGRVIRKNTNNEEKIRSEMIKHYMAELKIIVQANIWPALETMRREHSLKEVDFCLMTQQSPIIPPGRERLVAKALFSGYNNDFITALHILVPQIEHLVRFHLKRKGVETTTLDNNGIETENGLSTLVKDHEHEVKAIFGDDLAFELEALFCDPVGPNLRNELAHGLIDYEKSQSMYSIYAWWLGLRIFLGMSFYDLDKPHLLSLLFNFCLSPTKFNLPTTLEGLSNPDIDSDNL